MVLPFSRARAVSARSGAGMSLTSIFRYSVPDGRPRRLGASVGFLMACSVAGPAGIFKPAFYSCFFSRRRYNGAMSIDYKRGYSKGYAAGLRRGNRFVRRLLAEAKRLRERAEHSEHQRGLGCCRDCRAWQRNHECHWGYCSPPERVIEEPWFGLAESQNGEEITTHENFGCVRFELPPEDQEG